MVDEVALPELALACRRLGIDAGELVEAVLSSMDAGFTEREAVKMSIIELLQRRGAYHGRMRQAIEDGTIFQMEAPQNAKPLAGEILKRRDRRFRPAGDGTANPGGENRPGSQ